MHATKRTAANHITALLAGALAALSAAALAQNGKPLAAKPPTRQAAAGPAFAVQADKHNYAPGEPIQVTLTLKNPRRDALKLPFANGQRYDLELRKGDTAQGERLWRWSEGRMFPQMVGNVTLAPGKVQTFKETVTPGGTGGPTLEPGVYTLVATLTTSGRAPRLAAETLFAVESPSEAALAAVPSQTTEFRDLAVVLERAERNLDKDPADSSRRAQYVNAAFAYGRAVMTKRGALPPRVMYPAALALYRRALSVNPQHAPSRRDIKMIAEVYVGMGRNAPH